MSDDTQPPVETADVELPSQPRRAIFIYELEDGTFGSKPVTEGMSLDDAVSLAERYLRRANVQMIAKAVLGLQAETPKKSGIISPFGRK